MNGTVELALPFASLQLTGSASAVVCQPIESRELSLLQCMKATHS